MRPLAIDLFTGLHGWATGLVAEGFRVVGFDLEDMCAQFGVARPEGVQLVIQDVLTLHGSQFKDAALIVASPPCQAYSYMAMPWSKAKQIEREYLSGVRDVAELTALFNACFRIQREACQAAGRHIPMVVENVRGAQKWVGRSRWNFGSFHLWGDVPALMPIPGQRRPMKEGIAHRSNGATNFHGHEAVKVPNFRFDGSGRSFQSEAVKVASESGRRTDVGKGARFTSRDCGAEGIKSGGDWFNDSEPSISRLTSSKSPARKMASAMIAKIPLVLARFIAHTYHPSNDPGVMDESNYRHSRPEVFTVDGSL